MFPMVLHLKIGGSSGNICSVYFWQNSLKNVVAALSAALCLNFSTQEIIMIIWEHRLTVSIDPAGIFTNTYKLLVTLRSLSGVCNTTPLSSIENLDTIIKYTIILCKRISYSLVWTNIKIKRIQVFVWFQ